MTPETAILVALVLPAAGAVLVVAFGRWPNVRETVTLLVSFALSAVVLSLLPAVLEGQRPAVDGK